MDIQEHEKTLRPFPWRSLIALFLALFAQTQLEPPAHLAPAVVFYAAAYGFLVWALIVDEWRLSPLPVRSVLPPWPAAPAHLQAGLPHRALLC